MELLRFSTAGSVDDGKSTLIGRLLYDSKSLYADQLEAIEKASLGRGDAYIDLALLTDGLRAEREQRITIDVAYRYFSTPRRKFIIADTPGHVQYTRNMVTGASTADLAVVMVDARHGVLTQTKRHAFLSSLLQIPHLVVAINKMDLVDYSEDVYQSIRDDFEHFIHRLSVNDVTYIPMSALKGDNVVDPSENMPWFQGRPFLRHLESVHIGGGTNRIDFRFPVQYVIRPTQDFRGLAGQVTSGRIRTGDEVVVFPSGKTTTVQSILKYKSELPEALTGESVILCLKDELDVSRGDLIVRRNNLPSSASRLDVTLSWLNDEELRVGGIYTMRHTTRSVRAYVETLDYRIDVDTMRREEAGTLALNEIGRAQLVTTSPIFFDRYNINRATGSFILIDESNNLTVGAGIIRGPSIDLGELMPEDEGEKEQVRRQNIVPCEDVISLEDRESKQGHKCGVIWLTGLSGAGKSTLARALERILFERGCRTFVLDGDNVRAGLNGDLGFDNASREENVRRFAELAKLASNQGCIVICSLISPFSKGRLRARKINAKTRFLEVFVKCEIETCRERDPKGLYEKADAGKIPYFTGVSAPYEVPENPELVVDTGVLSLGDCMQRLTETLETRGWIQPK